MIPSSLVAYHDHSPSSFRKYSYRDFVKFYPWAVANHLVPDLPPAKVNFEITPYNSIYPSPYYLLPNQDLSRLLINPFVQFTLGAGDWLFRFYFTGVPDPIELSITAGTTDPSSFSVFRLFLVRVPVDMAAWLWGYVLDTKPIVLLPFLDHVPLSHFFIQGPPQQSSLVGNLDIREYCLMIPVMAAPTLS
jgi:hypothetical protein